MAHYAISNFDWPSLIDAAAQTGQIALPNYLLKLSETAQQADVSILRFSIMSLYAEHNYFTAYHYFLDQCSERELQAYPQWGRSVLAAVDWGNRATFECIWYHDNFILHESNSVAYKLEEADEKLQTYLKVLTPEEKLLQIVLNSEVDSIDSFWITHRLLKTFLGSLTLENFLDPR